MDVLRFITDATRGDLDSAISIRNGIGAIRRHSAKGRPYDVELGFRLEGRNAAVQYSVVLGSGPAGRYRVKREYGFVQESTTSPRRQFEIRAGNLTEPKASSVADQSQFQPLWADFRSIDDTSINFRDLALISSPPTLPRTPQERSKLQEASRERSALARFTTSMSFYRLFPDTIRIPRRPGNPHRLNEQGGNLASVLRDMEKRHSTNLRHIEEALFRVVPDMSDLHVSQSGGYYVVKVKHGGPNGSGAWFDLTQESDGSLRLLGLLTAIYQDDSPSLMGIEEPELTIHPGALAAVSDHLQEASERSQVLVTTHSPDLIDRLPIGYLRAVEMRDGNTVVNEVSEPQRQAVSEGLFSPGELHRMEGLEPASTEQG